MNRRTSAWAAAHAPAGTRWGKRMLALLLSLVLCLSLLPATALAADADAAAEVNGTQYSSLADAIENASSGSTVKLLKDVEATEKIAIEKKSLTIDLNGNTWKRTGTLLYVDSKANVTVKNGMMDFNVEVGSDDNTVKRETEAIILPSGAGSLTLENVSIKVKDGSSNGGSSTVIGYAVSVSGGRLTIRGDDENYGSYGRIYVNFNSSSPTVKLYGGSYTGIDLYGDTCTYDDLLAKGYIFVNAAGYINPITMNKDSKDFRVEKCTHEDGANFSSGYCSRCGVECPHQYNEAIGNNCLLCNKSLAAQVTDESNTECKYYIDLKQAFDEAAEDSTVKLLKEASGPFSVSTPIMLDCNGYTFNGTLTVNGSVSLASLLPEGYAFKNRYTDKWINDSELSGKTLTNFTTAEAPIRSVSAKEPEMSITLGQPVTLTAILQYPGNDNGFQLTWYCNGTQLGKEGIAVTERTYSLTQTPASAGSYTYRLVFSRDGYSKSCMFQVTVAQTYTVTFDANGGTLTGSASASSGADGKVARPADPTRGGYTFAGWYLGDREWNFETDTVTGSITLTAKWAAREYTVTANGLYGGTMGITPGETFIRKYAEGEEVSLQIGGREGYTLDQSNPLTLVGIGIDKVSWSGKNEENDQRGISFEMPANDVNITVNWVKHSSSGGGSTSSGTTKTETTTNPDGSTTKTETKSDGTVIETITGKDGSSTKTETKPDGSSKTEVKDASGSTGTVNTDKNGNTTANAAISSKAVSDAEKSGEPVKVPTKVRAGTDSADAPTVKIDLPSSAGETKVEIPVENMTPGTVAVLVKADGTEEIIKTSIPTETGIQFTVDGDVTVKIVDNAKNFTDTKGHWAEASIDFASARGLVNGTSDSTFSPNAPTTRAQLWTILARQAGADLTDGSVWYEKAQAWAKESGISDGSNPNGAITRAQMVTMLWRAEGSPSANSAGSFTDVAANSYYAQAVAWAVENGITTGIGSGKFDPNGTCTRAQIAAFLYRLYLSR